MIDQKITIIGGGNLGGAIAFGLIKSKQIHPSAITVTRRRLNLLEKLQEQGVKITSDNVEASKNADIIILAIKPYQVLEIIQEIKTCSKTESNSDFARSRSWASKIGRSCRL